MKKEKVSFTADLKNIVWKYQDSNEEIVFDHWSDSDVVMINKAEYMVIPDEEDPSKAVLKMKHPVRDTEPTPPYKAEFKTTIKGNTLKSADIERPRIFYSYNTFVAESDNTHLIFESRKGLLELSIKGISCGVKNIMLGYQKEYAIMKPTPRRDLNNPVDKLFFAAEEGEYSDIFISIDFYDGRSYATTIKENIKITRGSVTKYIIDPHFQQMVGVQLWEGGPLWATTNIGAESPEDFGEFFCWGEGYGTVPTDGEFPYSFNRANLSSEVVNSRYPYAPKDPARVNIGDGWRMPKAAELKMLVNADRSGKTTIKWTTVNGVNGLLISGRGEYKDRSIFLPAAGNATETTHVRAGVRGNYWSVEQAYMRGDSLLAHYLAFSEDEVGMNKAHAWLGFSIRPLKHVSIFNFADKPTPSE